jgi:chromosome segregation ATPase
MSDISSSGDTVCFIDVPGGYKPGESVEVRYRMSGEVATHRRDWVGLFKVGWTSMRDYYTFEWSMNKDEQQSVDEDVRMVVFNGSRLPPEDGNFYQFCFVSYNSGVKGASRPFQFTSIISNINDDLEIVEINDVDDSLLLLRARHETEVSDLQDKVKELTLNNVNIEASFVQIKAVAQQLKSEKDENVQKLNDLQAHNNELQEKIVALNVNHDQQVDALQATLVEKQNEIELILKMKDAMKQELDEVTGRVQELLIVQGQKEDEIKSAREVANKACVEKEAVIAEKQAVLSEKVENETQLRLQCSSLEERLRCSEEEREKQTGRSEYFQAEMENYSEKVSALEQYLNESLSKISQQSAEIEALNDQLGQKDQDIAVLQSNMCEIVGNINEPNDVLPVEDTTKKVDRAAYDALRTAYDDVRARYNEEQKECQVIKKKAEEFEARIVKCREEYERICRENIELKKQIKVVPNSSVDSITAELIQLRENVGDYENQMEEFHTKHEELMSEKKIIIEQMQKTIIENEQKINGLEGQIGVMKTNLEVLHVENGNLKDDLRKLRPNPPPPPYNPRYPQPHRPPQTTNDRRCPICSISFPSRISQPDFEAHVNTHFSS